jgi:hypothetical protein
MRAFRYISISLLPLILAVTGSTQSTQPSDTPPADSVPSAPSARPPRVRQVPCWKQAGLSPEMVNQRWKIEDQQKTKIESVCSDPITTAKQKHDKIDGIHEETTAAIAKLIPAKQLQEFNKCQAELDSKRPKKAGQKELGPCGGTIPTPADASSPHQHDGHSSEMQKPNEP